MRFVVTFTSLVDGQRIRRSFNATSRDECHEAAVAYLGDLAKYFRITIK